MIPSVVATIAIALAGIEDPAAAMPPAPVDQSAVPNGDARDAAPEPADAFATPVDVLAERMIGSASRAVRFDWRRSPVELGVTASELLERNNFSSTRLGGTARKSFGDVLGEAAVNYVFTQSTPSSQLLSLTPYRQAGRPNRVEVDINASYAVAEGVVTPLPDIVPPAEMVFLGTAGVRYLVYPEGFAGMSLQDIGLALASPGLTQDELDNLDASRLPGMQTDPGRYGILAGLTLNLYFQPGVFIAPRALVNVPLFSALNGSELGFWWETSIAVGFAL